MAASGRYKSRLLNYLVERSQKLSDRAGQRLRQARTGVVWGVQVLLYPLYVAFQTSRLVGQRLSQGGPMPGQARLTPPQADEAISAVLKLARTLADDGAITVRNEVGLVENIAERSPDNAVVSSARLEPARHEQALLEPAVGSRGDLELASSQLSRSKIYPSGPLPSGLATLEPMSHGIGGVDIRGVASELSDRALVLVDNSNRTVPLEAEQQWALQQTIVQQVADYNYRRQRYSQQLALAEARDAEGGLLRDRPLALPQPRARQLGGFRWMAHLMGWMQTSRLAQTANLFQESQLAVQVVPPPFLYWDPEPGQRLTRQTLDQLDAPLVSLEQRYIQSEAQGHESSDTAIKALRFTAKLLGLEAAAARWLRNIGDNSPGPRSGGKPGPSAGSVEHQGRLRSNAIAEPTSDPWEQALARQLQNDVPGLTTLPTAAPPRDPKPNVAVGNEAARSPRGWQRLTVRFGSLLNALKPPAGPIAPLSSAPPQPSRPGAIAPTNASIGLSRDARPPSIARRSGELSLSHSADLSHESSAAQGSASSDPSDARFEAAWQARLAEATEQEAKLKNVTSRSRRRGRPSPLAASGRSPREEASAAADPSLRQTAEAAVTYDSPYIETTAQFSGYEKHPLEIVLSRLDQILLWIEEQGLKLWRWLIDPGEQ